MTCKHKKTMTLSMGSLWGPFEVFCRKCGVCTSNPDVEPRLEEIKGYIEQDRQMQEALDRHEAKLAAMTPEEREQWEKELHEGIEARLNSAEFQEQLRPFRQRHNCLRRCDCSRRLD